MAKKAAAKVKSSSSKPKKNKVVIRKKAAAQNGAAAAPRRPTLADDPRFAQVVQNYEAGLKALQSRKFERAKALLEKVATGPMKELADRAAVHIHTCEQQLARNASSSFKSPEEHYDYAVSLMNAGEYDEARSHMEKLRKQDPKAGHVLFGLAALDCLTHKYEAALKNLEESIRLDAANRFRARNEPDFQNLADDPRFTELLYPETAGEQAAPEKSAPAKNKRR